MKAVLKYFLGLIVAAILLWAFALFLRNHHEPPDRAGQLVLRTKRIELVDRIRVALASAAEAEKSAVMAITDKDSQTYADEARAASARVEQARDELAESLKTGGTQTDQTSLAKFSEDFAEFERIDKDLLELAVKNTNLKASSLLFGPAAAALNQLDGALAKVAADNSSVSVQGMKIVQLADAARLGALRIDVLLPPHIAEASDAKEDELEAMMSKEDAEVRQSLKALAALPNLSDNADLAAAVSSYDRFSEIRAEILKLSRENTNVRSVAISLNQKRNVMFQCQDSLAALRSAIEQEPVVGVPARAGQQ